MRLLRATAIGVVGAAVVLLSPGVAAADGGTAQQVVSAAAGQDCARIWIWWIPFPCLPE